ncbi:hypothetical protein CDAR_68131 [Caerostris darwini]|uniref:Uncharacterized protein n=1 Tax=Caerostris darwini TaxID=1538125 RepID=A0AAV4VSL7_9ARAC|nr:hypothetical protein CDAR_68131 [Caerostris darwini]
MAACTGRKTAALLVYPALQGNRDRRNDSWRNQNPSYGQQHSQQQHSAPIPPRGGGAPSGGYWGPMSGNRGGQQWPPLHGNSQNTPFRPPSNPSQRYPDRNQPRDRRSYPSSGRGGGGSYSSSGIY